MPGSIFIDCSWSCRFLYLRSRVIHQSLFISCSRESGFAQINSISSRKVAVKIKMADFSQHSSSLRQPTWRIIIAKRVCAVDVRLHEPLLARGITLGDVRVEMMSLCSQLELLCRKELYEQPSGIEHGRVSNSFTDRATVLYDRMSNILMKAPGGPQKCLSYVKTQGLDRLFPRAYTYLTDPNNFSISVDINSTDNYFTSLSTLSQLSTLARQMHSDAANKSSHKYIAHQLALLYQTITSTKSQTFSQHKQSIEEMFKPIKDTLGGGGDGRQPCCTPEQQEWLLNLTSSIINTVGTFPAELTQDLIQPATIFQRRL